MLMPFCFVFDYILFFEKTSDGSMLQFFKMRFILEEEDCKILIFCKPKFIENSDATSSEKLQSSEFAVEKKGKHIEMDLYNES